MSKPHNIAIKSFNSNHSAYDQLRPSFPKALTRQFLIDLNLASPTEYFTDKKVLELAAGTGKFTRNLVNSGWGESLLAVEPSTGMLSTLKKNFPSISILEGSSYNLPVPDSSFDAVIIAQGFHWFSDLDSLKELNRVLKPEGKLGLIWNFDVPVANTLVGQEDSIPKYQFLFDKETLREDKYSEGNKVAENSADSKEKPLKVAQAVFGPSAWYTEAGKHVYTYDTNVPQYRHGKWRDVLTKQNKFFKPISKESFYFADQLVKQDSLFSYWETRSYITDLSQQEKDKLKNDLEKVVAENLKDSDKVATEKGEFLRKTMGSHAVTLDVEK